MAKSTREKAEPRPRMDGFSSTLGEYSTALADLNQVLQELQNRKEKLQGVLDGKQKQTAQLRAQADAQRVRERSWKEQESAALRRIKLLNEELDAVKKDLEKTRARGEELRQLKLKKVSEFEADMRELFSEFRSLRLLQKGEKGSREIAEELSHLVEEVTRLEEEHDALVASDNANSSNSFQLDTLQSIVSEGKEFLEEMEKEIIKMKGEEAALKQQLETLQKETDKSALQQDINMQQE